MASPGSLETRQFCRSPLEVAQFGFQDPGPATSPRMRPPAWWGRPGLCIPWSEEGADSRQACGSGRELRPLPGSREQAARPPRGPGTPLQLGLRGGLRIVRRPLRTEPSQAASSAPISLGSAHIDRNGSCSGYPKHEHPTRIGVPTSRVSSDPATPPHPPPSPLRADCKGRATAQDPASLAPPAQGPPHSVTKPAETEKGAGRPGVPQPGAPMSRPPAALTRKRRAVAAERSAVQPSAPSASRSSSGGARCACSARPRRASPQPQSAQPRAAASALPQPRCTSCA